MGNHFKILLLVFIILLGGCKPGAQAQESVEPFILLDFAKTSFFKLESYSCKMKVSVSSDKTQKPHISNGQFFHSKNRYHLDFEEDEITCDGKNIMTWLKGFGQATIAPYDPSSDLTLAGVYLIYQAGHKLKYEGEEGNTYKISLEAIPQNAYFYKKEIWVNKTTGLIDKFIMYSHSIGTYFYEISDVKTNEAIPEKFFIVDQEFVDKVNSGEIPAIEHSHGDDHGHDH